jgi:hypothetical protein
MHSQCFGEQEMPEHLATHFHSYWNYQKFSSHLTIQGFVPEKDFGYIALLMDRLGTKLFTWDCLSLSGSSRRSRLHFLRGSN